MNSFRRLIQLCRLSESNWVLVLLLHLRYRSLGLHLLMHPRTKIRGAKNIKAGSTITIGINHNGFVHGADVSYLNIQGELTLEGNVAIGRGCRLDIGPGAICSIGAGSYINPFTKIIIVHGLTIGQQCAISWNCHFLDEDFHRLVYEGKKEHNRNQITIGDNVWIGSYVSVYKGAVIANGCVVASNSVVKDVFTEENVLIAGNPAKIVKRDISWQR